MEQSLGLGIYFTAVTGQCLGVVFETSFWAWQHVKYIETNPREQWQDFNMATPVSSHVSLHYWRNNIYLTYKPPEIQTNSYYIVWIIKIPTFEGLNNAINVENSSYKCWQWRWRFAVATKMATWIMIGLTGSRDPLLHPGMRRRFLQIIYIRYSRSNDVLNKEFPGFPGTRLRWTIGKMSSMGPVFLQNYDWIWKK